MPPPPPVAPPPPSPRPKPVMSPYTSPYRSRPYYTSPVVNQTTIVNQTVQADSGDSSTRPVSGSVSGSSDSVSRQSPVASYQAQHAPKDSGPSVPPPKRPSKTLVLILILATILGIGIVLAKKGDTNASSYNREPIATGVAFNNNCIIDELDWFDDIGRASKKLQNFYNKTGVQPFIYLRAYDASLTSDESKHQFAEDWYDANIDNESTFLYMYFAEQDQDGEVGYMVYVNGKQVSSVMDAEAVNIFWNEVDNAWYKDTSTDDMFAGVFDATARKIMTKSTTSNDVASKLVGFLGMITLVYSVIYLMRVKRYHEAVRNAETERILKTDISGRSSDDDDLLNKWS